MGEEEEERACDPLDEEVKYNKYSSCLLLSKVLTEELAPQDLHRNHKNNKLLVAAVHAVLLDSGFVRFSSRTSVYDTLLQLGFSEFGSVSGTSHSYTLPQILIQLQKNNDHCSNNGFMLKFENISNNYSTDQKRTKRAAPRMVRVSGSLISTGSKFGKKWKEVCLEVDENKFAPAIEFFWGKSMRKDSVSDLGCERQVCELWRFVKDGIALPMLVELCEEAGLPAPLCLMSLPPELKLKILEAMPVAGLVKVEGVCKELRDLANDNELWKHKFAKVFADEFSGTRQVDELWKETFRQQWVTRKISLKRLLRKIEEKERRRERFYINRSRRAKRLRLCHDS